MTCLLPHTKTPYGHVSKVKNLIFIGEYTAYMVLRWQMVVGGGSTANFCSALLSLEVQWSLYSICLFLKQPVCERRTPVWTNHLEYGKHWYSKSFWISSCLVCLWRLGGNWNTRPRWRICDLHTKASWWQAIVIPNMRWQSNHLAFVMST